MRLTWIGFVTIMLCTLLSAPAFAYDEVPPENSTCADCHYGDMTLSGPHGVFDATSDKCSACHTLHDAPGSLKLLGGDTVKDSCFCCHDGTSGQGVYGTIAARGLTVASGHPIESTSTVPGGDPDTGGSSVVEFRGAGGILTCSDCHSPHGNDLVNPWKEERLPNWAGGGWHTNSKLIRQTPTGTDGATTEYGSDWCLGCHKGRNSGGAVHNHPVETSATADYFYFGRVAVAGVETTATSIGIMPQNNGAYVMPYPRSTDQAGHYPICQQCHEDARSVGDVTPGQLDATEVFTRTLYDGRAAGDNPRFMNFPHESTEPKLLIENDDDLCLNCHPSSSLP